MAFSGDQLQPTPSELACAIERARKYWHHLANEAFPHLGYGIQLMKLQDMLFRVPEIPAEAVQIYESNLATRKIILTRSSSTHCTEGKCNSSIAERSTASPLLVGIQTPVACLLSGSGFQQPDVTADKPQRKPHYLAILSLAWAYILSSRLLELQKQKGYGMSYTTSRATLVALDQDVLYPQSAAVYIGMVDKSAARWWAAILAPDQGWKAVFTRRNDDIYFAPWSYSLAHDPALNIQWQDNGAVTDQICPPPTSQAALKYLIDFCVLHGLREEFDAALAAVLTFPTHYFYTTTVEIPYSTAGRGDYASKSSARAEYIAVEHELPYFMALSCNYSVVMSSLCGSFWEPTVGCNFVTPWLHPVMEEMPKIPQLAGDSRQYHELVAIMCAIRRPSLLPLWTGASLTGLVAKVIDLVRTGTPPLDPNGAFWTGSPQNFLDLAGTGPYFETVSGVNIIRRVDVWRLLYLPPSEDDGLHYENLPFTPWQPIGKTRAENCVLRVRVHEACPRHQLLYSHWTWQMPDGLTKTDSGYQGCSARSQMPVLSPKAVDKSDSIDNLDYPRISFAEAQCASQMACCEIFRWVLANQEGKPPLERIYDDPWLADCRTNEESDPSVSDNGSDTLSQAYEDPDSDRIDEHHACQKDRIRQWAANVS
ncbi:hypothetical protein BJX66DRAFT_312899 [Aspergillus keveii]|uniref:Ig-like domain-containing protein n=1 Tax=Aspergillus keveii TaxID=714993 RepID=A0ABR4FSZ3_9EURO